MLMVIQKACDDNVDGGTDWQLPVGWQWWCCWAGFVGLVFVRRKMIEMVRRSIKLVLRFTNWNLRYDWMYTIQITVFISLQSTILIDRFYFPIEQTTVNLGSRDLKALQTGRKRSSQDIPICLRKSPLVSSYYHKMFKYIFRGVFRSWNLHVLIPFWTEKYLCQIQINISKWHNNIYKAEC